MNAREYFEQASDAARDIRRCEETYKRLCAKERLQAQRIDNMPRGNGHHDFTFVTDARLDFEASLPERLESDNAVISDAYALLYGSDGKGGLYAIMGGVYADILYMRYVELMKWEKIAEYVFYTDRNCRLLARKALDFIDERGFAAIRRGGIPSRGV